MRRAMTWVYCEPKSRMRIFEWAEGADMFSPIRGEVVHLRVASRKDHLSDRRRWKAGLRRGRRARVVPALPGQSGLQWRSHRCTAGPPVRVPCKVVSLGKIKGLVCHCKKMEATRRHVARVANTLIEQNNREDDRAGSFISRLSP